jgi:hypothetical protein
MRRRNDQLQFSVGRPFVPLTLCIPLRCDEILSRRKFIRAHSKLKWKSPDIDVSQRS